MLWADYSAGRPSGAALRAAGFGGAIRYIGLGSAGKRITAAEYQDLTAAGISVLLVAEYDTNDAWRGYDTGKANAEIALAEARALGIPDSVGIAGAADAHASGQAQLDAAVAYARGFGDVLGRSRAGFYGFPEVVNAVRGAGVVSWYWRCGAEPSYGDKLWLHFWQRNAGETLRWVSGVPCDINEQYNAVTGGDMQLSDTVRTWDGQDITIEKFIKDLYNEYLVPRQSNATQEDGTRSTYFATAAAYTVNADMYGWRAEKRMGALETSLQAVHVSLDSIAAKISAPPAAGADTGYDTRITALETAVRNIQAALDSITAKVS